MGNYHIPVMLQACLDGLAIRPEGTYVDVTFGGGGHARALLNKLGPKGRLLAFDQDAAAQRNLVADARFIFVRQNFRYLKNYCHWYGILPVDGILADLGVSSHQLDQPDRGFSTRFDGVLDMRMDQSGALSAKDIVNSYSEADLYSLFSSYGEVHNALSLAKALVRARANDPIETVTAMKQAISPLIPRRRENKYLAQVFQALRIVVNLELEALQELLLQSVSVLAPEGRLVVISYHSLEDRLVKRFMATGKFSSEPVEKDIYGNEFKPLKALTRKAIFASDEEANANRRARSARLRVAVKVS